VLFLFKCLLQHVFSILPKGEVLNYFFQRYVTRSLPLTVNGFLSRVDSTKMIMDHFRAFSTQPSGETTCLDFSSGMHLQNQLGLSLLGLKKIYTYDVQKLARPELVTSTIQFYRRFKDRLPVDPSRMEDVPPLTSNNLAAILWTFFRIVYKAPANLRATGLEADSLDLIVSRNTLEHIPEQDIRRIIPECRRLLKKGGVAIFSIDYRDHWSFFDPRLTIYHFLKYGDAAWKLLNPRIHYQNRLRHIDYGNILRDSGLTILKQEAAGPDQVEQQAFRNTRLAPRYRTAYAEDELWTKRGVFVLRK